MTWVTMRLVEGWATSVFTCPCDSTAEVILFGWDDVKNHARCSKGVLDSNQANHNLAGAASVATLVTMVDLDPLLARVADLDRLDARFLCAICQMKNKRVYTWRGCVCTQAFLSYCTITV